jgi:hypothetical protein
MTIVSGNRLENIVNASYIKEVVANGASTPWRI